MRSTTTDSRARPATDADSHESDCCRRLKNAIYRIEVETQDIVVVLRRLSYLPHAEYGRDPPGIALQKILSDLALIADIT